MLRVLQAALKGLVASFLRHLDELKEQFGVMSYLCCFERPVIQEDTEVSARIYLAQAVRFEEFDGLPCQE